MKRRQVAGGNMDLHRRPAPRKTTIFSEVNDLAAEQPDKVEDLTSALRAWEKEMGVPGELAK